MAVYIYINIRVLKAIKYMHVLTHDGFSSDVEKSPNYCRPQNISIRISSRFAGVTKAVDRNDDYGGRDGTKSVIYTE